LTSPIGRTATRFSGTQPFIAAATGDLLKFTSSDVLTMFAKSAGMSSVEFKDGQQHVPTSGRKTPAMDGYDLPPTVALGQSLCVMRA
jgi:hypothetical protein